MKMNWYNRKRWIYRAISSLTVTALAIGFTIAHPTLSKAAEHVKLEKKSCKLTVKPSNSENAEFIKDLGNANVVIDLYKVANAVKDEGYDTYTYNSVSPYSDLNLNFNNVKSNKEWMELAQEAADIVFPKNAEGRHVTPTKESQSVNSPIDSLDPGLYLVIARGSDMNVKDYVKYIPTEAADSETKETYSIVTLANSDEYTYTFLPELISLPYRGNSYRGYEEEFEDQEAWENWNEAGTAAQYGEWIYDLEIALKPEREARYVSLDIVKELPEYSAINPADTFVFQVKAYIESKDSAGDNDGDKKYEWRYSDVVSISFTEGEGISQNSLRLMDSVIDKIRVGATVEVTEVYTGANYTYNKGYGIVYNVDDKGNPILGESTTVDKTVTFKSVEAGKEYAVVFENAYDKTDKHGGAVTNRYDNVDAAGGRGWEPSQTFAPEKTSGDDTE